MTWGKTHMIPAWTVYLEQGMHSWRLLQFYASQANISRTKVKRIFLIIDIIYILFLDVFYTVVLVVVVMIDTEGVTLGAGTGKGHRFRIEVIVDLDQPLLHITSDIHFSSSSLLTLSLSLSPFNWLYILFCFSNILIQCVSCDCLFLNLYQWHKK